MFSPPLRPERLCERWTRLSARLEIKASTKFIIALSGGADSVLLTHIAAASEPPIDVVCVHVDHDLRPGESSLDAQFAENLCRSLGIPFAKRYAPIPIDSPDLEARARELRYAALLEEARRVPAGEAPRMVLTGHHADDALETLLMRWMRGGGLSNMSGLRDRVTFRGLTAGDFPGPTDLAPVTILRPLIAMRRAEIRRLLSDRGLTWRDDSSNTDRRFFRNRLRHGLLSEVEAVAGPEGLANLTAFSQAVESMEDKLSKATAHICWHTPGFSAATGSEQGGEIARRVLVALNPPLMRRALWRLITEGTGAAPGRNLLDLLLVDLARARCGRHNLPGGWTLVMRSDRLQLLTPQITNAPTKAGPDQILMPWGEAEADRITLTIPGIITLPDGRRISAEVEQAPGPDGIPKGAREIMIDYDTLLEPLAVRWPATGDRFHPLGAPGAKPLRRFLADAGVPREERGLVPLVISAGAIVWAAGLRPAESVRVRSTTRRVLRLTLHARAAHQRGAI